MPKVRTLRPAPGRVVIKKLEGKEARLDLGTREDGSKAMLILPAGVDPRYEALMGIVEQESPPYITGGGATVEPSFLRGQLVLFSKFSGTRVEINNSEFYILNEQQIIAELVEAEVPDAPVSG